MLTLIKNRTHPILNRELTAQNIKYHPTVGVVVFLVVFYMKHS